MKALAKAVEIVFAMEGRLTPLQAATLAAEFKAEHREPWWGWSCHLAAAIAVHRHGISPQ